LSQLHDLKLAVQRWHCCLYRQLGL
jgi:hypothetical protein